MERIINYVMNQNINNQFGGDYKPGDLTCSVLEAVIHGVVDGEFHNPKIQLGGATNLGVKFIINRTPTTLNRSYKAMATQHCSAFTPMATKYSYWWIKDYGMIQGYCSY